MTHQHAFARTDRSRAGVWWWTVDHWLLGAVGVLIVLGVILSFGSSPAAALRTGEGGPFHFAIRQTLFPKPSQWPPQILPKAGWRILLAPEPRIPLKATRG